MKVAFGRTLFWLTWPLIWIYAPLHLRPRIFVVYENKFLAVKPYFGSGAWQLPGGGMRKGESELSAAVRELVEETGVAVDEAFVRPLLPAATYKENGLKLRYSIFYIKLSVESAIKLQKNEIGEAAWLPLEGDYIAHIKAATSSYLKLLK